jgi:hypothetical protein
MKLTLSFLKPLAVVLITCCLLGCSVSENQSDTYQYTRAALGTTGLADTVFPSEAGQIYVISAGEAAQFAANQGFSFELVGALGSCGTVEFTESKPWYTGSIQLTAGSAIDHSGSICKYSLFGTRPLAAGWKFVRLSSYSNGRVADKETSQQWVAHHDFSSVCQQNGRCGIDGAWSWKIVSEPEFGSDSLEIVAEISAKPKVQGRLSLKRLHLMGPKDAEWQQAFQ